MAVNPARVEIPFGNGTLVLETGKLAKQAHGAVVVRFGDTMVLVAAVEGDADPRASTSSRSRSTTARRTYAAGKFPGGFIKREGRPDHQGNRSPPA